MNFFNNNSNNNNENRFINCLNILVTKGDQYAAKVIKKCLPKIIYTVNTIYKHKIQALIHYRHEIQAYIHTAHIYTCSITYVYI